MAVYFSVPDNSAALYSYMYLAHWADMHLVQKTQEPSSEGSTKEEEDVKARTRMGKEALRGPWQQSSSISWCLSSVFTEPVGSGAHASATKS